MYIGMPVMVTQNIAVDLGVANGTLGWVWGIKNMDSLSVIEERMSPVCPRLVQRITQFPECIFVKIRDAKNLVIRGLPQGVFPVLPETVPVRVRLGVRHVVPLKMTQFPLSPATSLTIHKTQGLTLDAAVIGSLDPLGNFKNAARITAPTGDQRIHRNQVPPFR
jgi:ATP-dependent exoDNAse (exonuclease V) alpha subunit